MSKTTAKDNRKPGWQSPGVAAQIATPFQLLKLAENRATGLAATFAMPEEVRALPDSPMQAALALSPKSAFA